MRVNLGAKIGLGFFVVIVIVLIVGVLALFQMKNVQHDVTRLADEYIQEVDVSSEMERNALQTMYAMRGYSLIGDDKYLGDVKKHLGIVDDARKKAGELLDKYPHLVKLKQNIAIQDDLFAQYKNMLAETESLTAKMRESREIMNVTGVTFLSQVEDYFETQKNTAEAEVEGAKPEKIIERLQKMHEAFGVYKKSTAIVEAVGEAQVSRNLKHIDTALTDVESVLQSVVQLLANTVHPKNKIRLEETRKGVQAYKESLQEFRTQWQSREDLNAKRGHVAQEILRLSEETSRVGMEQTHKISRSSVDALSRASYELIIGVVIGIILSVATSVLLTRAITKPLFQGVTLAQAMANGDLSRTIEIRQHDEIGQLADSLNHMVLNLRKMLGDISEEVAIVTSSSTSLAAIADQMTSGATTSVRKAELVSTAASELSANQNSVAAAMEQASVNVSTVATAAEEMSATIGEIASNSGKAKSITDQAVQQATEASIRVNHLGVAANEINKVTETITAISSQTNLLALNATIEAARAGDAGRGFAVVANEIKELALQTARATEEIRSKIQGIQQATRMTVGEISEISDVIGEVDSIVATIAAAVEEQSVTTREIAENVGQASSGIAEVNTNVAQSSAMAGEIAGDIADVTTQANETLLSSEQVKLSASGLSETAAKLKGLVSRFTLTA